MIYLSQLPSYWMWYLTLSSVRFLTKKIFFFPSLCVLIPTFLWKQLKVNCTPSWWYTFLFYFNICIKLTLWAIQKSLRPATLLEKALASVFFGEFCEIFKNNFCAKHLWTTASGNDLNDGEVITSHLMSELHCKNNYIDKTCHTTEPFCHLRY